ncbi:MAG: hypothetical protein SRB2_00957 [Desulfobacteraceae bacterium Eth-SRB2]|nr:MAG: hypothetical protein SRB2_00957 [Desulfobacteraceae bacterium Eth-SRB2]
MHPGVVKIAVYTDGILIPFLFHILRFQVSGARNDEQGRWPLKPDIRHTGRNKYGIFFKAILWAILITPDVSYLAVLRKHKLSTSSGVLNSNIDPDP